VTAAPACPFCDARDVERVAQWGGQMITAQWRCRACGSYFEALREELDDPSSTTPAAHVATPPDR
jgi:ribosomal protein L37AE/L43A